MMGQLQGWTWRLCMVCLIAGAADYLCETGEKKKVLKLILMLYILVTAFAGEHQWQAQPFDSANIAVKPTIQQVPDITNMALRQAELTLSRQLSEKYAVPVAVMLEQRNERAVVCRVTVAAAPDEAVRAALCEELGVAPHAVIYEGGGSS